MSRGTNQKFKLSYMREIMLQKTDDDHYITMPEILAELEKRGVTAERKSIYDDLADLSELGIEIEKLPDGRGSKYHVISRPFELAELKLLVDAVQSSRFITAAKSRALIKKIEGLGSEHEQKLLARQIYVQGRVKTMNESTFKNIDYIYNAIAENKKVEFKYYRWDIEKKMEFRNHGNKFKVSPWGMIWNNENYYMVALDSWDNMVKSYRVDKMTKLSIPDEEREGKEIFEKFDIAEYSQKNFSMFNGNIERVKLELSNDMANVLVDRFGDDITFQKINNEKSFAWIHVAVTKQFFAWMVSLNPKVKIVGPEDVVKEMKDEIKELYEVYF